MPVKWKISPEVVQEMERILWRGNRAEIQIEHGKITVVEIKRKMCIKSAGT